MNDIKEREARVNFENRVCSDLAAIKNLLSEIAAQGREKTVQPSYYGAYGSRDSRLQNEPEEDSDTVIFDVDPDAFDLRAYAYSERRKKLPPTSAEDEIEL